LAVVKLGTRRNGGSRNVIRTGMNMKSVSRIVLLSLLAVLIGGGVFLATWDIPAPLATVEKVIPDDRFRR
jgi:cell division septal protein FtsQ